MFSIATLIIVNLIEMFRPLNTLDHIDKLTKGNITYVVRIVFNNHRVKTRFISTAKGNNISFHVAFVSAIIHNDRSILWYIINKRLL